MGKSKIKERITAWSLVFALCLTSFVHIDFAKADASSQTLLSNVPQVESAVKYSEYLQEHSGVRNGTETISQKGTDYSKAEEMQVTTEGETITTGNSGKISWDFTLKEEGMYQIQIEYFPVDNGGSAIEFGVYINGELPFEEASPILFYRTYADENKDYQTQKGNQAFPSQIEVPQWKEVALRDYKGYFQEPLTFYLKEGKNTISIKSIKDCMKIKSITILPAKKIVSYEEYLQSYGQKGIPTIETAEIKIQAEDASGKSSPSFYPINDRTSAASEPYDPTYIVLNTIGGTAWKTVGDWIEWQVEVPQDGLYKIGLRYRQNELRGLFAVRSILINGEYPFKEAADLRFPYNSKFQVKNLQSPDGEEFYFYLKKGTNTIALENSLGAYADLIYRVEDISDRLNDIYQEIVVITGTNPDTYQDYQLTNRIPNMLSQFEEVNQLLKDVKADFTILCGGTNDKTAVLERANDMLDKILKKPSEIPKKVTSIRDTITSLGQWVLDVTTQPLTLDYILINGENNILSKAEGTLWQNVKHEFLGFIGSFTNDYNVYTADTAQKEERKGIEVWVTTGRDQMDVIRQLVNESFTTETGIPVTLKLVSANVLLTSTSVGRGPDAVIQVSSTVPVDFAVRDAAYDITQFEDFEEVSARFHKAALDCFAFNGHYYGLPDQMSFPVLFYRTDILNKYNIPVPTTWEEVISIIPYLQANNMEFYLDRESMLTLGTSVGVGSSKAVNTVYLSMLYQNGGELYNEAGTASMLNSDESLDAFTTWTEFYTRHSFSTTMDFVTRFRLGEVPLAIMDFTYYNRLSVSAPEINGKWSIAVIPGTKDQTGEVDYSLPVTTSASVIIKNSVEKHQTQQEAWEFLKWWTSAEIQTDYAREMEAVLGSSGRYPVANLESFQNVAWRTDILNVLTEELNWLREVRQVPGSYITGRYIENAFYEIVNDQTSDPIDVMYEYNTKMTEEIQNKLREFGIETE